MRRRLAPLVFLFSVAGCDSGAASTSSAPAPDALRPDLALTGGALQSGFAQGITRVPASVGPFRIHRRPVTLAQYKLCVAAGQCAERGASCTARSEQVLGPRASEAEAPAHCVQPKDAMDYCEWVGGRLPTLNEWLVAARGIEPQRFARGKDPLSCLDHPIASDLPATTLPTTEAEPVGNRKSAAEACAAAERTLKVGAHPALSGPSGMEDVLLMPAELLATDDTSFFPACGPTFSSCVVFGDLPGEIGSLQGLEQEVADDSGYTDRLRPSKAFAFRCVRED